MSEIKEAAFEPSPDDLRKAKAIFQALDRSTFAHLRFTEAAADMANDGHPRTAVVHVPGDQSLEVQVTSSPGRLRLEFNRQPDGFLPTNVTLLTPALVEEPLIQLGNRSTAQPKAAEDAYPLAARSLATGTEAREGWQTDWFVGSHGLRAKLQQAPGNDKVAIHCQLPSGDRPPVVRYRIAWADAQGHLRPAESRTLELDRADDGGWEGYALPGAGMEVDTVRKAPGFEVRLAVEASPGADWLTAAEFSQTMGDEHQVLALIPASDGGHRAFDATFRSNSQRRLWSSPSAWRMVRFQPL